MFIVTETATFQKYANKVWTEEKRMKFIAWIAENYGQGDVIPGFTPLRKIRWQAQGKGKRGGVRIIYFVQLTKEQVNLLMVYPKSTTDNLSQNFLRELRKLVE